MPNRSRLRYENPPTGLPTKLSDLTNRWINLFCCHAIKYECFIHFTYVFTILYMIPRMVWLSKEWSLVTEYDAEEYRNFTRSELPGECHEENVLLPVPILSSIIEYSFKLFIMITYNCSPHLALLQNDYGVFILFGIQYSLSLFYMVKAKSRNLFGLEFAMQVGYKFWASWLSQDWEFNDIFQMKKIILCLVLSDADVSFLARNKRNWSAVCCPLIQKPNNSTELEISSLWTIYEKKTSSAIFQPNLERVEQILERRKTLRNYTDCDVKLNSFIEFLIEHYVLEEDTLRILLFALENFDEIVSKSNSLRLSQLDLILK